MQRKNFFLPEAISADLKALATKRGVGEAEIVREALRIYLEACKRAAQSQQ